MKLTKVERWMLANQYRILEALYPKEKKSLQRCQEILEHGFEYEYSEISKHIYKDEDALSEQECREVIEILTMFNELGYWYGQLKDKKGIDKNDILFSGFDGNDTQEVKYLSYARFVCEAEDKPFAHAVKKPTDLYNSHFPALEVYRRMMEEWKKSKEKRQLTKEDIVRIVGAKVHPSNR